MIPKLATNLRTAWNSPIEGLALETLEVVVMSVRPTMSGTPDVHVIGPAHATVLFYPDVSVAVEGRADPHAYALSGGDGRPRCHREAGDHRKSNDRPHRVVDDFWSLHNFSLSSHLLRFCIAFSPVESSLVLSIPSSC